MRAARSSRRSRGLYAVLPLVTLALALGACDARRQSPDAPPDVIAQAAGTSLTVEKAARLLAANPGIPAETASVRALADLWVDYALLAAAVAADSSLDSLRLDEFTAPDRERALAVRLRKQVIPADTMAGESEDERAAEREAEEREGERAGGGAAGDERRRRAMEREIAEEQREELRRVAVETTLRRAEAAYLDSLLARASFSLAGDAVATARALARRPYDSLDAAAAARVLATHARGTVTAGEFVALLRLQPLEVQSAVPTAPDAQLADAVRQVARKELLLAEAAARNVTLSSDAQDSIRSVAARAIRAEAARTGLLLAVAGRRPPAAAMEARLDTVMHNAITRRVSISALGRLGAHLRGLYPSAVHPAAFEAVVRRLQETRRSSQAGSPAPPTT